MAVLFDVYDNAGGATFSAAGATITLNLDTIREEEPNGSGTPWDLTTDQVTYNDTQVVLIRYDVTAEWSSDVTVTVTDHFWVALEVDAGSGYVEVDGARAYSALDSGTAGAPSTCGATIARTHITGDKYRLRVTGVGTAAWKTKVDASRLTIWVDEYSVSGSASSAAYVTIGNDSSLSNERALTGGEGVTFADGGANAAATLTLNVPGLAAYTAPLTTDFLLVYDDTAKAHKKILLSNFLRVSKTANTVTSVLTGAGGSALLGACVAAHIATMNESDFAGTPIADAVTALTDFRSNGDWRNLRTTDSLAIDRAQQALSVYTNWTGAGT